MHTHRPPTHLPLQAKEAALERLKAVGAFRTEFARLPGSGCVSPADLDHAFGALLSATMRRLALEEGWRCDGRGPIDLRPVHCEVGGQHGVVARWRGRAAARCAGLLFATGRRLSCLAALLDRESHNLLCRCLPRI